MATRVTVETILRDADDALGKSIREWVINADPGHVTIRLNHGTGFIMLGVDDIEQFVDDLRRAGLQAKDLNRLQAERSEGGSPSPAPTTQEGG